MKLNPQQAPLYGECVLTVQLSEEEYVEDEEDVEFYLLFAGTTQRHLTTTLRVSHVTLQAVCPAHDRGETVRVTLCQARPGGSVDAVAEERFQYVQDLALDMAHFLLSASGQRDGLERALLLDECQIPLQECERLDETLALALRHIPLPPGWSVLGTDINTNSHTDLGPQETLLHFAARRGLRRVALFLLQQPGGRDALRHQNKQGHTPAGVAQKRGHSQLQHLLSELEDSPCYETKAPRRRSPGGRAFLHHPSLNTYTLTVDSETDVSPPDLRADVEELQRFIQSHQQEKGLSLSGQDHVSLILSRDIGDSSQKAAITSCPGPSLQNPAEHREAEAERGNGELLNGTRDYIQSEELEEVEPDGSARADSGKVAGEGVCAEGREESAAVSGASCGERQQEEADREVGVITAEQKEHFSNKTYNKAESGNPEEAAMGQSQGLLPSETQRSEESDRRRDLPKEKEGEASSGQETAISSALRQDVSEEGGREDSEKQADGCCSEGTEVNSVNFGTSEALIGQESPSLSSENISFLEESGRNTSEVKKEGCGQGTEANSGNFSTNQALIDQESPSLSSENISISEESGQNTSEVKVEGCCEGTEANSISFNATFGVNSEVNASQTSEEAVVCLETGNEAASSPKKDTGNHSVNVEAEQDKGFSGSESGSALDSISLRPNMAPGPIHNVQHEPSPLPDCRTAEETVDTTDQDQHQQTNQTTVSPAEGTSDCSEQVRTSDSSSDSTDKAAPSEDAAGVHGLSDEENPCECVSEAIAAVSSSAVEGSGEMVPTEGLLAEPKDEKKASEEGSETPAGGDQPMVDLLSVAVPNEAQILSGGSEDSSGESLSGVCEGGSFSDEALGETLPGGGEDTSPFAEAETDETSSGEGKGASLSDEAPGETLPRVNEDESPSDEAAVGETLGKAEDASLLAEAAVAETSKGGESASPSHEAGVEETSRGSEVASPPDEAGESSQRSEVSSNQATVGEILSKEHEGASPSVEAADGRTLSREREGASPSVEAGVGGTEKTEGASPSVEAGVGGTLSREHEGASSSVDAAVGETLSREHEGASPSVEAAVGGTLSREHLGASPSVEAGVGETEKTEGASPSVEAGVGQTEKTEGASSSDEAAVRETSPGASQALSEPQNETALVTDTTNQIQSPQNEASAVDQTQEVLLQLTEPASKPEELSCSSSEATVAIAGNCEAISHGQPGESSETKEDCVKLNEESASLDIASQVSDGSSASPCDSASKEDSSAVFPDPQSEVIASGAEGQAPLPGSSAITVELHSDSGFSLDNTSTSDSLSASAQPVEPLDKDSGTFLGLDTSSPVEVDSGLSQGLPPSDTASSLGGLCESKSLDEGRNQAEEECSEKEKPREEQVADDLSVSADVQASLTDMDQTEIHRETEVFYPLESCANPGEPKEPPSEENTCAGHSEGVCRSVSVSSLPESESISDGDSLVSTETVDDSVFKQSEDTVTLAADSTSGVSVTGSSSTDDWSSLGPCGSDPPVENTVTVGSDHPLEGAVTVGSEQPVESAVMVGSEQPVEGAVTVGSDQPVKGAVTVGSSQPVEGAITVGSSQPAEGAIAVGSSQPVEGAVTLGSDQPPEGTIAVGSSQPVEGTVTVGSDQPVEGSITVGSDPPGARSLPATGETEEEEKKDQLTEVPERSTIPRSSVRSLSPSRRHSWGPSRNSAGEADMGQRSVVQSEDGGKPAGHRRSMSWCPSDVPRPENDEMNARSYSLEGLVEGDVGTSSSPRRVESQREPGRPGRLDSEERGSLVSLTEEEQESDMGDASSLDSQRSVQAGRRSAPPPPLTLTKSISMSAISPRDLDAIGRARPKRRISFSFSVSPILPKSKTLFAIGSSSSEDEEAANLGSFTSASGSLECSISEEDPAPLRSEGGEVRVGGTKVSRTFSYLKSKMSKKSKEKDREKSKDGKEKEKRSSGGHLFSSVSTAPPSPCLQCSKPINTKDALQCTNCSAHVHKGCKEGLPACAKVKMKQQQQTVPDSASAHAVAMRTKSATARERPWSTMMIPDDQMPPPPVPPQRKSPGIMAFNSNTLSKSISISNIAGQMDDTPLKPLKFLSQSTDSLHKISRVNESTESLTDEGAELMDGQLMGDFEADAKELEADSWSLTVDRKYLKQLKKDVIKRQDVIYELIQTEMHHVRTLRIMADVYSKGLLKEVQLGPEMMEKMFPMLDELLDLHTLFLTRLLERKRMAQAKSADEGGYTIRRIGHVLLDQVTGFNAERMTKVYGKFCSRHNEAVNLYKEFHAKDKRFQAVIRKMMSNPVVRRLSIPECVLLVTQRITKYPVLLQRILQHTKDPEEEQMDMTEALQQMKEVIAAVDLKVSEYEKRRRLKEIHSRTDSKSIMRMRSGQMFAREDLIRGRRLVHDGPLQLKNAAGRLKDVQALLLSDVFVFLQEKDQKYVFASLDQRSTVISLHKLIVREVANEERGLFLITVGMDKPEMVEVYASSKVERNTWIQLIQGAMQSIEREDDEGIPSENEEDKRLQEIKAKEMRDLLQKKDEQIVCLLEEKVRLFRELCESAPVEDAALRSRMMFRATSDEVTKGEPIIKDALKEVEKLQELVNGSVCGAVGQQVCAGQESASVSSVSLPRRAETFGGFDSHQMNSSKIRGEREEVDESAELRRTESDSVLKKGGNANLLLLLKRNSEQVLQSVTRLHDLLNTLQAVVVQQDTFIEDQRQALLSDRPSVTSRHPSVSSLSSSSSSSSRPASLIEQEKQRSAERQRQEAEERRRREREWEQREKEVQQREERVHALEEENTRVSKELDEERNELQNKKEEYQRDLARLRDSQRRLEREREQLYTHSQLRQSAEQDQPQQRPRTSSSASEDSLKLQSSGEPAESAELSTSLSAHDLPSRVDSKRKSKNLNPFSSGSSQKGGAAEPQSQIPSRLLQLAKPKEKKEKKKKKGKGQQSQNTEAQDAAVPGPSADGAVFFC
ncbi:A-kinase anchor protein 13 isoform X4 [Colossoma macropomum]|uniref:A-kinase anchor protein 13 isoform X4 n=1 Tax=Colossoma macropomum TaxID=42526 RepID=UPI001864E8DF|nr:A-kinase anchor protein 13 isoform X4 [Colossoma macropomum]